MKNIKNLVETELDILDKSTVRSCPACGDRISTKEIYCYECDFSIWVATQSDKEHFTVVELEQMEQERDEEKDR